MSKLIKVFFKGKFFLVFLFIAITLLSGVFVIFANNQLSDLLSVHFTSEGSTGFLSNFLITIGLFILVYTMGILGGYISLVIHWGGEFKLKKYFVII